MKNLKIKGGSPLNGKVRISGSKNAALPIFAATLLTDEKIVLNNVPDIEDVRVMIKIIEFLGKKCEFKNSSLEINGSGKIENTVPYDLIRKMRASFNVLGPLSVRNDVAMVSLPGGCNLGPRPVDIHLEGLNALGFDTKLEHGIVKTRKNRKLKNIEFTLRFPSIGATQQLLTTCALMEGTETILNNIAIEPEIGQLVDFLKSMGSEIKEIGAKSLLIKGKKKLYGTEFDIVPDRIEIGTFLIAAAATRGSVEIENCIPANNDALLSVLSTTGALIEISQNTLNIKCDRRLESTEIIGRVYPGFPTDLLPLATTLYSTCIGESFIKDEIFPERLSHVWELQRMNADITVKNNSLYIKGIEKLSAAPIMATDIRCSSALIIAGLCADGITTVGNIDSLFRGYENFEDKLSKLGADLEFFETEN